MADINGAESWSTWAIRAFVAGIIAASLVLAMAGVGWGQSINRSSIPYSYLDADTSLTANSDTKVATQKAVKAFIGGASTSGNAATATKLATPRNINGVPFDGSADISVRSIILNPGMADLGYNGLYFTGTAGENVAIGDVCYLKSDGKYYLAKADVATTKMPGVVMATTTINAAGTGFFLARGFLRYDAGWGGALTVGAPLYVSITGTSGNTVTQTAPSASGNIVQDIGYAYAARVVFFDPNRATAEVW